MLSTIEYFWTKRNLWMTSLQASEYFRKDLKSNDELRKILSRLIYNKNAQ